MFYCINKNLKIFFKMSQHKCHFINKAKIPKISKINIIKRLSCHILQSTKKSSKSQMFRITGSKKKELSAMLEVRAML